MPRFSLVIPLLGLLVLASCGTQEPDEPELLVPGPTIAAPAFVTAGRDGIVASVPPQMGGSYEWSIQGGELLEGQGTHSIVFAAAGPGSLRLSVRIVDQAGALSHGEMTISVVAPPDATLDAPTVVTRGKAGLEASVSPQAGRIEWTIAGGVITSGNDSATVTFTAGEGAALTLGVVVTNDAGDRGSFQRDIRIVPAPVATIVADEGPFTTGAEGLHASAPWQPHSTFTWSVENGTITEGQGTESIVFAVGEPGRVRLTVEVTNEAGDAVEGTDSLDAVPLPIATISTPRAAVTTGASELTASLPEQDDSTFAWSVENGTITGGQGTASITFEAGEVGELVISATVTNAAGDSDARTLEIRVVPPPDATIAAPVTVTAEKPGLHASVPEQADSTFAWSVDGGTILEGQGSSAITFMAHEPGTAVLSVTVANAAGDLAHGNATLFVVPTPTVTVSFASGPFTEGRGGLRATVPAQDGSTYAWQVNGGAIDQGQGTPELVLAAGAPGVLEVSVTVTNAAGDAASSFESRTVVPAPNATITAVQFATEHAEGLEASVPAQENSTFTWSISGGTITSGEGTDRITFTAGGVGVLTLSVSVENAASDTASGDELIEIVAPPDATLTVPDGPLTSFKTYRAQVPEQPGTTYDWQVSQGLLQGGQGTSSIQFFGALESVTVQCTVTNAGGDSETKAATFSVVAAPGANFSAPTRVIKGQAGLVATVPIQEGATYAWAIRGGTIDSRTDGPEITFTAGLEDVLTLELVVTNTAGDSATRVMDVDVVWGYSTFTGQMTTPRKEAAAVTLHDGRVLVAGGRSMHYSLRSAETFSMQTESFTATRDMAVDRSEHTMTLLPDGRVLVVGGVRHHLGPTEIHARAEIFDPTTNTWSNTTSMLHARYNHSATLLADGRVLVAGGNGVLHYAMAAEIFDPATETWTPAGTLLHPRGGHDAVLMADGRVLISGSGTSSTAGRDAEIFNPATGSWSQAAGGISLPWGATLSPLPGGEVLLAGGTVSSGPFTFQTVQEAKIYDPAANAFYPAASMHGARSRQVSFLLPNGRVLQAGGHLARNTQPFQEGTRTAELYDPPTDTFLRAKDLLEARVRPVAAVLPDGSVLIAGGHGDDVLDVSRTAEIFTQ